jgi:hypothetical protein
VVEKARNKVTARSLQTLGLGVLIALAMPLAYLVLAYLIGSGMVAAPTGAVNDALKSLGLNATAGFVLAALGLSTIGRGAGIRNVWAWTALAVIGLPLIAVAWFFSYATLGGATGSPF